MHGSQRDVQQIIGKGGKNQSWKRQVQCTTGGGSIVFFSSFEINREKQQNPKSNNISKESLSMFSDSVSTVAKRSSRFLPRASWVGSIHQITETHPLFKLNLVKMTFL